MTKQCNICGEEIDFDRGDNGNWIPVNPDGSPHTHGVFCKKCGEEIEFIESNGYYIPVDPNDEFNKKREPDDVVSPHICPKDKEQFYADCKAQSEFYQRQQIKREGM